MGSKNLISLLEFVTDHLILFADFSRWEEVIEEKKSCSASVFFLQYLSSVL